MEIILKHLCKEVISSCINHNIAPSTYYNNWNWVGFPVQQVIWSRTPLRKLGGTEVEFLRLWSFMYFWLELDYDCPSLQTCYMSFLPNSLNFASCSIKHFVICRYKKQPEVTKIILNLFAPCSPQNKFYFESYKA